MDKPSGATKRLLAELKNLIDEPSPEFVAQPLESDIFEWHFTIRGPPNTSFQNGRYHGRIIFPLDYPFKPPNIVFLTPNGRFEVGKKICLSITGFHPESWRPAWGIRTALIAIIGFLNTPGEGAVGALDWSDEARKICAKESVNWKCNVCKSDNSTALPSESEAPSTVFEAIEDMNLNVKDESAPASTTNLSENNASKESSAEKDEDANTKPTSQPASSETPRASSSVNSQPARPIDNTLSTLWTVDALILGLVVFILAYFWKIY